MLFSQIFQLANRGASDRLDTARLDLKRSDQSGALVAVDHALAVQRSPALVVTGFPPGSIDGVVHRRFACGSRDHHRIRLRAHHQHRFDAKLPRERMMIPALSPKWPSQRYWS